jgi:hypothetical protein
MEAPVIESDAPGGSGFVLLESEHTKEDVEALQVK